MEKTFDELLNYGDIFLIQEHWLFDCELTQLDGLHESLSGKGKAVDTGNSIPPTYKPRAYGGVAVLWKKAWINWLKMCRTVVIGYSA